MTQTQELLNTRGYQSSVDFNLIFGIGKSTTIDKVEVIWPNQKKQIITNVKPNQIITLFQKDAVNGLKIEKDTETKLFKEVTKLDFTHKENNYNDFKREIMLPHMLSTLGPKLAVGDVNKDGIEDGLVNQWYDNGQKQLEVTFKDKKPYGVFMRWNEDGSVKND